MREHEPWWEPIVYRGFLRLAAPWVDLFLANSKSTLLELWKMPIIAQRPGFVVYNSILTHIGSPTVTERLEARRELGLPSEAVIFGFAGRIVERKGWRDFVSCAKRLISRENIFWILAGDGPEEKTLRAILSKEQLINVKSLGFLQSMDNFYRSLDACIIPSHWEPHGLVQLEAQSYGIPVIAANVGGMNETITDRQNALLFEARDVEQLIRAVEEFLGSSTLAANLSRGALANALRFTVSNYHDALEAAYRTL